MFNFSTATWFYITAFNKVLTVLTEVILGSRNTHADGGVMRFYVNCQAEVCRVLS